MKTLIAAVLVGACALGVQRAGHDPMMNNVTAETYGHLAEAIIQIRATEDNLVNGILLHYRIAAERHMAAALEASGKERGKELELAAEQIANIAHEGDKQVQAIRQRLLKAGHHHHTDAETEEDYIFVDSTEKQAFLLLATGISKLGANASDGEVREAMDDLLELFDAAVAPE